MCVTYYDFINGYITPYYFSPIVITIPTVFNINWRFNMKFYNRDAEIENQGKHKFIEWVGCSWSTGKNKHTNNMWKALSSAQSEERDNAEVPLQTNIDLTI